MKNILSLKRKNECVMNHFRTNKILQVRYYNNRIVVPLICFLLFALSHNSVAQSQKQFSRQAFNMLTLLENNHYSEKKIDQKLSESSWTNFFNYLDPYHVIFLAKDLENFAVYKTNMAENAKNQQGNFLEDITKLYKIRLEETDSLISVICSKPILLYEKDTLVYSSDNSKIFPVSQKEQKRTWEKLIKNRALMFLNISDNRYTKSRMDSLLKCEPAVREKTEKYEKRIIQRILNKPAGYENYLALLYMNSFATCFDPHTYFFTSNEKRNFEDEISTETFSFGFDLDETPEMDIKISRLVPGGPAWNSNLLKQGDVILKLRWNNNKSIDLTGASLEEVSHMLKESSNDKLTLTVRKANGISEEVTLTKAKITAEENLVKGVILKGEKKIGYISLPGFYTEWDNPNEPGCANDVAKEIIKLQADTIEGLILDIRSNGGGSMTEALNLAGIFIDEGPLCLYQQRGQKPIIMKDMNRGTVYNGPLIVMVNSLSASASELISATLQDYHRALIVGNPTFGKASGQIILPNDTSVNVSQNRVPNGNPESGYVVTTTFKFYRVTGSSHQLSGVIPDVSLPDLYRANDEREIMEKTSLPKDSVIKKVFYNPLPPLPVKQLSINSKKRCDNNAALKQTSSLLDSLDFYYKKDTIILDLVSYINVKKNINRILKEIEKSDRSDNKTFSVLNSKQNNEIYKLDEYSREVNEQFTESLKSDMLLEETYGIMNDLINYYKLK